MNTNDNWSFFVDLDGTIYTEDTREWEYNLKQFKLFCDEFKVNRFIATGRHPVHTIDILSAIPLTKGGLITLNGGLVFLDGEEINSIPFDNEIARKLHDHFYNQDASFVMYTRKGIRYTKEGKDLNKYHTFVKNYKGFDNSIPRQIKSFDKLISQSEIFKFISFPKEDILQKQNKEMFDELNLQYGFSLPGTFEINPPNVSKGNGVKAIVKHLSLNPNKIIGVGDGENDISLAKVCKIFVAMNNGAPRLKEVATKVAEEKGFAWALNALHFLIKD